MLVLSNIFDISYRGVKSREERIKKAVEECYMETLKLGPISAALTDLCIKARIAIIDTKDVADFIPKESEKPATQKKKP